MLTINFITASLNLYIRHVIFSLLFLFNTSIANAEPMIQPLAVGGVDSSTIEIPWQVYILISAGSSNYACGGSIIADDWVVTAAHCLNVSNDRTVFTRASAAYVRVYSGSENISDLNLLDRYTVSTVVVHSDYQYSATINDIALLQLSTNVRSPAAAIATLTSNKQIDVDNEFTNNFANNLVLTGWGKTSTDRLAGTDILQKVEVTGINDDVCSSRWNLSSRQGLNQLYLCADAVDRGACNGDSGGPLIWQDKLRVNDADRGYRLAGIVSFGSATQCADNNLPDVYTQVSHYETWISATISGYAQPISTFSADIFATNFSAESNSTSEKNSGSINLFSLVSLLFIYKRRISRKYG